VIAPAFDSASARAAGAGEIASLPRRPSTKANSAHWSISGARTRITASCAQARGSITVIRGRSR
jgi:hypothetical protein